MWPCEAGKYRGPEDSMVLLTENLINFSFKINILIFELLKNRLETLFQILRNKYTNLMTIEISAPSFPNGKMFIHNSFRIILWWFGSSRILKLFSILSSLDSKTENDMFSVETSESLMRPIWFLYFWRADLIEARSMVEIA